MQHHHRYCHLRERVAASACALAPPLNRYKTFKTQTLWQTSLQIHTENRRKSLIQIHTKIALIIVHRHLSIVQESSIVIATAIFVNQLPLQHARLSPPLNSYNTLETQTHHKTSLKMYTGNRRKSSIQIHTNHRPQTPHHRPGIQHHHRYCHLRERVVASVNAIAPLLCPSNHLVRPQHLLRPLSRHAPL